jgi:hypothetical protein
VRDARTRYEEIVDALTSWYPEVRASRIFGMPCLKRSGRVIVGFTRGAMVFKFTSPDDHARALALPGAHLFDPSGRDEPFRQWVVVPPEHAGAWDELAYTAFTQDHSIPRKD